MLTAAFGLVVTVLANTLRSGVPWSRRAFGLGLAVLPAAMALPRNVLADEDARAQARRHFARGVELAQEGAYAEAVVEFGRAYELSPHHSVLYNIGQAYVALGRPVEAVDTLRRYLAEGGHDVPSERRAAVEEEIRRLSSRIAELEITTDLPNATIWVDGVAIGRAPLGAPARVGIGRHRVVARSDDGVHVERVIQVAGEERRRVELAAPAVPRDSAPMPAPPDPRVSTKTAPEPLAATPEPAKASHAQSALGFALGGLGVALGGAALGHFLWNKGRYDDWRTRHERLAREPDEEAQRRNNALAESIDRASAVTVGLGVGAAAALGAGVVLIATDASTGSQRRYGGFVAWRGMW